MRTWLQQKDVDALFGVAPAAPEVRPYDFLAPPRLPREQRAVVDAALERLAPALAALLGSRLRKAFEVVPAGVETVRAGDLANGLPDPCVAWPLTIGDAPAVLELGVPFALAVVDRSFGGAGDAPTEVRVLTALEQRVVAGFAAALPAVLREAFRLPSVSDAVGDCRVEPGTVPFRGRDEVFVVVRLDVRATGLETRWTLGVPLESLAPLFVEPATPALPVAAPSPLAARELQHAHVRIVARMPLLRVRAGALAELAVGDTLPTPHAVGTPVEVLVNGLVRWRGTVGRMQGRLALQITETVTTPTPARPARDPEGRAQ